MTKSKSITISLQEHVYNLAYRKAKLIHGNNFSNYINSLICKDFKEEDLINELKEVNKPAWANKTKYADFESSCMYCGQPIYFGDLIYETNLGYEDKYKNWVHEGCCRKDKDI
jgi:hypothetical protein